ncbi:hypothetical protein J2X69_000393 [Algoriphagus sp. 4150]|nr:hypothetical protein [Algoriphagus sp. 4150]
MNFFFKVDLADLSSGLGKCFYGHVFLFRMPFKAKLKG